MICGAPECGRPACAKGLCKSHYERLRRGADVYAPMRRSLNGVPLAQRFAAQRTADPSSSCHLWTGTTTAKGYGSIKIGNRTVQAHRIAYELHVGPIPPGMEIDHLCRVRSCVNPAHLEAVTHHENTLRSTNFIALNARKTHCLRGHPLTGDNVFHHSDGRRECRECRRLRGATYRAHGYERPVVA